jgi:hypothetical protein
MTDSITTATSQADASAEVQRVRADLMKGAIHWNEVVAAYDPIKSTGPAEVAAGAAASMAHNYAYVLAALLGQMADTDVDEGGRWTAADAAGFVDDLLTNGDCDDLNGDIVIAEQPDGQQKAASHG